MNGITLNTSIKIYNVKSCGQSVCTCVTHLEAQKEDYHQPSTVNDCCLSKPKSIFIRTKTESTATTALS